MCFFFFNDTATTEIYTLSLHDALPICGARVLLAPAEAVGLGKERRDRPVPLRFERAHHAVARLLEQRDRRLVIADRKSTRLNSSHANISYAVFCLKKKKIKTSNDTSI